MPIYLLDADTLIRAENTFYRLRRVPEFWDWLRHNGEGGSVKVPVEQYEEVVAGAGDLVDWLKEEEIKAALLFEEEADPRLVAHVTMNGDAPDLNDAEPEKVGRDPFLVAYGFAEPDDRFVVTFETPAPAKQRANRKIPDVCAGPVCSAVTCSTLLRLSISRPTGAGKPISWPPFRSTASWARLVVDLSD